MLIPTKRLISDVSRTRTMRIWGRSGTETTPLLLRNAMPCAERRARSISACSTGAPAVAATPTGPSGRETAALTSARKIG